MGWFWISAAGPVTKAMGSFQSFGPLVGNGSVDPNLGLKGEIPL